MAEWMEVMNQFDRMCLYHQRKHECPMGCPMSGVNISQCRKIAFECPDSVERTVMSWAAEHPEPVYPTWGEYLHTLHNEPSSRELSKPIPADIAEKLGIEPKEANCGT